MTPFGPKPRRLLCHKAKKRGQDRGGIEGPDVTRNVSLSCCVYCALLTLLLTVSDET